MMVLREINPQQGRAGSPQRIAPRAAQRWLVIAIPALLSILTFSGRVLAQKPLGVDVSYWQGSSGMSQANWDAIAAAGRSFAFVRIGHYTANGESDDHGSPDPTCNTNVTRAKNAGLLAGVYYFA